MKKFVMLVSLLTICAVSACVGTDNSSINSEINFLEDSTSLESTISSGTTGNDISIESGEDSSDSSSSFTPITNGGNYTPDKNY